MAIDDEDDKRAKKEMERNADLYNQSVGIKPLPAKTQVVPIPSESATYWNKAVGETGGNRALAVQNAVKAGRTFTNADTDALYGEGSPFAKQGLNVLPDGTKVFGDVTPDMPIPAFRADVTSAPSPMPDVDMSDPASIMGAINTLLPLAMQAKRGQAGSDRAKALSTIGLNEAQVGNWARDAAMPVERTPDMNLTDISIGGKGDLAGLMNLGLAKGQMKDISMRRRNEEVARNNYLKQQRELFKDLMDNYFKSGALEIAGRGAAVNEGELGLKKNQDKWAREHPKVEDNRMEILKIYTGAKNDWEKNKEIGDTSTFPSLPKWYKTDVAPFLSSPGGEKGTGTGEEGGTIQMPYQEYRSRFLAKYADAKEPDIKRAYLEAFSK